jgi:transaldolase/glucose-6-phosphate isomerase
MGPVQNTLQQLLDQGQSPWIDYIARDILQSGRLRELIDMGIVGLTSNPTIFQKAIGGSDLYDDELRQLVRQGKSVDEIYDALVLDDIRGAANIFRPIYDHTNGRDGYVSIEVAPNLAYQTEGTFQEVCRLFTYLNLPNVMIKIPGTPEGIPAVQRAIAAGVNVNVTLLFALESYRRVAEAYIAGLEERANAGQPVERIASVASFFVSRVDTAVDKKLDAMIAATADENRKRELDALHGKAAIANAKLAYAAYQEIFAGPRWEKLAQQGARAQRCLWASTSTKNPRYRDVMYVEWLIGPDTVDTMPPATIDAFLDHGVVERTLDRSVDEARAALEAIEQAGISMDEVTLQLQKDGVQLFAESFDQLIQTIDSKRAEMMAHAG